MINMNIHHNINYHYCTTLNFKYSYFSIFNVFFKFKLKTLNFTVDEIFLINLNIIMLDTQNAHQIPKLLLYRLQIFLKLTTLGLYIEF